MNKLHLIILSIVLAGGITAFLITQSNNDSTNNAMDSGEVTTNPDTKGEPQDSEEAAELSEMPSENTTSIGETVAIDDLETPDNFSYPVSTNHFEISENTDGSLTITLFAIINRPEQYEEYQQQLKQFKAEALQYLDDNGVNTNTVDISYTPEEAKDL